LTVGSVEETSTLLMCPEEMTRLGLKAGGKRHGTGMPNSKCFDVEPEKV
jgi:hypothetical protein